MAVREDIGETIAPGVIQRIAEGVSYVVRGVTPTSWFGPQQPLTPQAQKETEGRAFDYPVGYNLQIQPRAGEGVSFGMMRNLADGYDLLRLVIETRKDQIEAYEWEIVPKDKKADAASMKGAIDDLTQFLQRPDQEHLWSQWLRMQIEELLVVDAVCIYPRPTNGGDLYALELVDGSTIKRVLDDGGRTPQPPSVAYQQVLKGIPTADYSTDDLIYVMRNPRISRIYGYSPVEQIIMTVNIALRRQLSQLDFYTQGNIPEAIAQVPETWTGKMIGEFQTWWDSVMEGNLAQRRRMRFIPSLDKIVFPKQEVLKDEYDEWLARIVCFAFSITPGQLIKQMHRASGEQMSDTAKEEGLQPMLNFLAAHMTEVFDRIGYGSLAFRFKTINKIAPDKQALVHKTYIDSKVMTPDEVREELGMDAMTPEQRDSAFPAPITPGFDAEGRPLPPAGGDPSRPPPGVPAGPGGAGAPPAPKAKDEPAIEKALPAIHVHMAPVHVDAPQVVLGDTHVHVPPPPQTIVKVHGDTTIQAPPVPMSKRVVTKRDPATGDLYGTVEWTADTAPAVSAIAAALEKRDV